MLKTRTSKATTCTGKMRKWLKMPREKTWDFSGSGKIWEWIIWVYISRWSLAQRGYKIKNKMKKNNKQTLERRVFDLQCCHVTRFKYLVFNMPPPQIHKAKKQGCMDHSKGKEKKDKSTWTVPGKDLMATLLDTEFKTICFNDAQRTEGCCDESQQNVV